MKKKIPVISAVAIAVLLVLGINFPVYRFFSVENHGGFSREETKKLLFIGTPWDRAAAGDILDFAKEAFADGSHSAQENQEKYGPLARYTLPAETQGEGAISEFSLRLWSAHLGEEEGTLWVYYSQEWFDGKGNLRRGSSHIPALWKVAKQADGRWVVTEIKEQP